MVAHIAIAIHRDLNIAQRDILETSRRRRKTRSPWRPDLLCWVLGHRRKCLYLHDLRRQLTCGYQSCTVSARDKVQQFLGFDLLFGVKGVKICKKTLWDNQGGKNCNRCTQRLVILRAQTHERTIIGHQN